MSGRRRMKLLTVVSSLGPGGAERQITNLAAAREELPVDHVVVQLGGPGDLAPAIRDAGGRVIDLGLGGRRPWLRAAVRVARVFGDERPDVIKTDLFDANLAAVLARLTTRRVPLVTTLHNLDYEPATIAAAGLPPRRVELLRRVDRMLVRSGATYVACSHAVAESARARIGIPVSRMRVIHNSIDVESFVARASCASNVREELGLAEGETLFLNVGRLDPQKGQDVLLAAFAEVRRSRAARLAIAGDGPLRRELHERARALGIDGDVTFLGVRRDIPSLLAAADVFLLPSFFEGFPVSLIEAMGAGKAIVASRIAPITEAVGEAAVLVHPGSVGDLARGMIEAAANDDLRRRLGQMARSGVDRFRTGDVAGRWHDLFRELTAVRA